MKKFVSLLTLAVLVINSHGTVLALTGADWQAGRIIDDSVFSNKSSMTVAEIQQFLIAKHIGCDVNGAKSVSYRYPFDNAGSPYVTTSRAVYAERSSNPAPSGSQTFTCLKDYFEVPKTVPGAASVSNNYGYTNPYNHIPNGAKSAAQLIYDAAQVHSVSPKVLLVTLQKEQGLLTDDWPLSRQYLYAMGAHCPDSGPGGSANCDANYAGFSLQMLEGASLFRYYLTNMSEPWWPYKKPFAVNSILRNVEQTNCGSTDVYIESKATAALYTYTPYQPNKAALDNLYGTGDGCSAYGNRNFWRMFNDWFGATVSSSCRDGNNIASAGRGQSIVGQDPNNVIASKLTLVVPNQTGSACIESHTWSDSGLQTWMSHTATNSSSMDPAFSRILASNAATANNDLLYKVDYQNTSSGKIEVHGWDVTGHDWLSHVATNRPAVNMLDTNVIAADLNGDKRDEFYLVEYRNTGSGRVEVHGWTPNLQNWSSHTATNLNAIGAGEGIVMASDRNGDGRDELNFIKYTGAQSGRVEMHTWNPGFQTWSSHIATNLSIADFDAAKHGAVFADLNADKKDEMFFVKYSGTGSARIELHGWSEDLQRWVRHTATNEGSY